MKRVARGFTLIEMMVTVVIISILSAIALPAYRDYVTRSRLTEAFSGLAAVQPSAEQYWANNRTFIGFSTFPAPTANFTFSLSSATVSSFVVTATGSGPVAGFSYTIDQSGGRATTAAPSGWGTNGNCWVDRKGGTCSQ